jgi:hypothetical protein
MVENAVAEELLQRGRSNYELLFLVIAASIIIMILLRGRLKCATEIKQKIIDKGGAESLCYDCTTINLFVTGWDTG